MAKKMSEEWVNRICEELREAFKKRGFLFEGFKGNWEVWRKGQDSEFFWFLNTKTSQVKMGFALGRAKTLSSKEKALFISTAE